MLLVLAIYSQFTLCHFVCRVGCTEYYRFLPVSVSRVSCLVIYRILYPCFVFRIPYSVPVQCPFMSVSPIPIQPFVHSHVESFFSFTTKNSVIAYSEFRYSYCSSDTPMIFFPSFSIISFVRTTRFLWEGECYRVLCTLTDHRVPARYSDSDSSVGAKPLSFAVLSQNLFSGSFRSPNDD